MARNYSDMSEKFRSDRDMARNYSDMSEEYRPDRDSGAQLLRHVRGVARRGRPRPLGQRAGISLATPCPTSPPAPDQGHARATRRPSLRRRVAQKVAAADFRPSQILQQVRLAQRRMELDVK